MSVAYRNLKSHSRTYLTISQRVSSPGFVLASVFLITWHQLFKACFSMATLSAAIHSVLQSGHPLQDFRLAFRHVKSNESEVFLC